MKALRLAGFALLALLIAAATAFASMFWHRPGLEAYAAHRYVAPPAGGALTASWYGVTALLLSDGTHSIFIDPFFTRPQGFAPMLRNGRIAPDEAGIIAWLQRAGATRLDAVLVSHSHFDHAMDAGAVARLTGAKLVGSESTLNIGRGDGVPEAQLQLARPGEPIAFGNFSVTFIASQHADGGAPTGDITAPLAAPAHYLDYRQGGTFSILVEHPQGKLLHHGSAGFVPGALRGRHADVVFLGVALLPDLKDYLGETVDAVGARRVIPMHWDDFTRPLDEPLLPFPFVVHLDSFFADIGRLRPDVVVQTLDLAQPVALFPAGAP